MWNRGAALPQDLEVASELAAIVKAESSAPGPPSQLARDLWLGGLPEARDGDALQALGITHVLNMAHTDVVDRHYHLETAAFVSEYLGIDAEDHERYPLFDRHFDACLAFYR